MNFNPQQIKAIKILGYFMMGVLLTILGIIATWVTVDHITWLLNDITKVPYLPGGSVSIFFSYYRFNYTLPHYIGQLLYNIFSTLEAHIYAVTRIFNLINAYFFSLSNIGVVISQIILIFINIIVFFKVFKKFHPPVWQWVFYLFILMFIFNFAEVDVSRIIIGYYMNTLEYAFLIGTLYVYIRWIPKNIIKGTLWTCFMAFLTGEVFAVSVFVWIVLLFLEVWAFRRKFTLLLFGLFGFIHIAFVMYRMSPLLASPVHVHAFLGKQPIAEQIFSTFFHNSAPFFLLNIGYPLLVSSLLFAMIFLVVILTIKNRRSWNNILKKTKVSNSAIFLLGTLLFSLGTIYIITFTRLYDNQYAYHAVIFFASFIALGFMLIQRLRISWRITANIAVIITILFFVGYNLNQQTAIEKTYFSSMQFNKLYIYVKYMVDKQYNTDAFLNTANPLNYLNFNQGQEIVGFRAVTMPILSYYAMGINPLVGSFAIQNIGNIFRYTKQYGAVNFGVTPRANRGCWSPTAIQFMPTNIKTKDGKAIKNFIAVTGGIPSVPRLPYAIIVTDDKGKILGEGTWSFTKQSFRHPWTIPFYRKKATYNWLSVVKVNVAVKKYHVYIILKNRRTCEAGTFQYSNGKVIDTTNRLQGYP